MEKMLRKWILYLINYKVSYIPCVSCSSLTQRNGRWKMGWRWGKYFSISMFIRKYLHLYAKRHFRELFHHCSSFSVRIMLMEPFLYATLWLSLSFYEPSCISRAYFFWNLRCTEQLVLEFFTNQKFLGLLSFYTCTGNLLLKLKENLDFVVGDSCSDSNLI